MVKKRIIARRLAEIVSILFKYGFSEIVSRLRRKSRLAFRVRRASRDAERDLVEKPFAIRIRLALEELGPTFIKFGQVLSMRPDILPQNIILELQKLQDQVPAFKTELAKQTIENQLGKPFSRVFRSFQDTPEAAASIAQVHKATLFSGETVAVKIRRPGIQEQVSLDLEILLYLAQLAERALPETAAFNPAGVVREFAITLHGELDFLKEARNIECFQKYFGADPHVHIPKLFWDNCSESLITMEYIDGIKISDRERLIKSGADLKLIARRGVDVFFRQIFEYGFFHADPHSGNIFILPGDVLAPIDFGMVGFVNDFHKEKLSRALRAFIQRDARLLVKVLKELELLEDHDVTRELTFDAEHLINYYYNISLAQLNLGTVIMELIDIIRKHHIRIPTELVLLGKSIGIIETVGKELDPSIDIAGVAAPYVQKLMMTEVDPIKRVKDSLRFFSDSDDLLRSLPEDLHTIVKKIRNDKLKVKFEHQNLDRFIRDIDKSSNRISFSVIIAAFVIGASLVTNFDKGPTLLGIPVLGFFGYVLAGIFGILFIIGVIRSGRL